MPGGRGRRSFEAARRDGDPQQGLDLVAEVLGRDLAVEEQDPGRDEAVEPAAGRGLGAAERGGQVGYRDAAVLPDLNHQCLVLGVEDGRRGGARARDGRAGA